MSEAQRQEKPADAGGSPSAKSGRPGKNGVYAGGCGGA